jgi:hypothetical protein
MNHNVRVFRIKCFSVSVQEIFSRQGAKRAKKTGIVFLQTSRLCAFAGGILFPIPKNPTRPKISNMAG